MGLEVAMHPTRWGSLALHVTLAASVGDISFSFVGKQSAEDLALNFNSWVERHGAKDWSKIRVAVIPGFRLGAVATEPISPGEVYLEVPWRMIISEDSIGSSDVGVEFQQIRRRHSLGVGDYLLLYLLH